MPIIRVFPNTLDSHPAEVFNVSAGIRFEAWLKANVPSFEMRDNPPFTARLNGGEFLLREWSHYQLMQSDCIDVLITPKDLTTIAYIVVLVVSIGYSIYVQNQIPDNYNQTTPDGSSIYSANLQGNRPRLMGVVPEIAGRHKHYPDLLNNPRREYIDHQQWIYLMLCIGVGDYALSANDIFIGDTEINRYIGDIGFTIYSPGQSLVGEPANRNFYSSDEVGGTAGGGQGLELQGALIAGGGSAESFVRFRLGGSFVSLAKTVTMLEAYIDRYGNQLWRQAKNPFSEGFVMTISGAEFPENNGDYLITAANEMFASVQKLDINGDEDPAWIDFTFEGLSEALVDTSGGAGSPDGYGIYSGPFFACPKNETTSLIALDFFMARGLGKLEDSGAFTNVSVEIEVQYRPEGGEEWTSQTYIFSGASSNQQGHTRYLALTSAMRPEVRVRRLTEKFDNSRIYDTVEWQAMRAELSTVESYPGVTTLAVKMRGTNTLARSAENKLSVVPTRILPIYENGQWQPAEPTTSLDAFFAYVVKSVGHGDEVLELPEMERLRSVWEARGDSFSAVFDNETTLFPALKRILAPGFAEPILEGGKIIPVRDEPRTSFDYMYQPDNMIGPLKWGIKLKDPDEPDGIEVEYMSNTTWKPETVLCLLGDDQGINPRKVRAFGITNKDKAWQYGMRDRRILRYRRKQYTFTTEMDGLNSSYLSYDALGSDIPGYSQTGRVTAVNGRLITLNQPLEWTLNAAHFIALRRPNGTLSGPYSCTKGDAPTQVLLGADIDFTPDLTGNQEPPLFQFGSAERWTLPVLITDIKVNGTDRVKLTAVNYDARVYADDDNLAPEA